jgi:GR25 family glycosyltransferase involved in LPS biosynthesis
MRKSTRILLYNIGVGIVLLALLALIIRYSGIKIEGFQAAQSSPYFTDAYVVTLSQKYPERLERIKANAEAAGIILKPWEGVIITKEDLPELPKKGIGTLLFQDRKNIYFNFGAIGCYLAHRNLLESIAAAPNGLGTFICEDDIIIPTDFYTRFAAISSEIPDDWDIIYMRKYIEKAAPISAHIKKLEKDITATHNSGMWGFIVKNTSIKAKILPVLEQMTDAIDLQLNRHADKINMYLVDPPLISMDVSHSDSIIHKMDIEGK